MIKRIIPLLFIISFILMSNPVMGANEPVNLTAVPFATYVELQWDDVASASHYSVYRYLPAMLWTNATLELDGTIDQEFIDDSQRAVAFSPNPPFDNAYDTFYILRNNTYVFMAADTYDNDFLEDDTASVYVDFDRDGLTAGVDLQYEIEEDGTVNRNRWDGDEWKKWVGTGAIGSVGGAATSTPVYELWVPIAEMPGFTNETWHYILIERSDSHTTPTIYNYQPRAALPTSTDGWAPLNITAAENQTFFSYFNVTESEASVTGLDAFDWYRFGVTSTVSGVESNHSIVDFITLSTATYNISGTIHDAETLLPIANAEVVLTDTFVTAIDQTDVNGNYAFSGVIADDYTVNATKSGYDSESLVTIVIDADITNHDIFMDKTIQDEIPLWLFVLFVLINIGAIAVAFHNDLEISIFNIFCSFMATILCYLNSKILINGYLIESFEFGSTIQNAAYSAVFHYAAIIMAIITGLLVIKYVKEILEQEDL